MATHRLTITLEERDVEILTRLSTEQDRSLSSVIRTLVRAEQERAPEASKKATKPKK